ncbi:putative GTP-binding protein EngA [Megalodesulfovibrio gigas DSM 1382 = ATCC 19364]|uniref:GTPase Der n=1 Tax=Megalodesulfovibrio gigas (strain ATCC 19364 / DSM 1382 / NCIMB 9332 / VKM B-1759) TaxID=1121448 RepID=T2GBA7_MEGG1|nr:putative GTP-binding protein EngA [Megalodesulfovibrio gigas DSM 1382 = ATCC 19364]
MPVVALIGRPNVGKSTLFNGLTGRRRAITHDRPGVTRDRMDGLVRRQGLRPFLLIDTGGVHLDEAGAASPDVPKGLQGFEREVLAQAQAAVREADVLLLVVDGREGLSPLDERLADYLRQQNKPLIAVVNKVDGGEQENTLLLEFYATGLELQPVSAAHGRRMHELLDRIEELLPAEAAETTTPAVTPDQTDRDGRALKIAMLGKPNAGKSSLVNALAGEERMIVSEIAGTTRDSVDVRVERGGKQYLFVDTAGIRRRTKIIDSVERFSVSSALLSARKADVILLVLDVVEGVSRQDKKLISFLDEEKLPFIVLVNKMDLPETNETQAVKRSIKEELSLVPHVPVLWVSAATGKNLNAILSTAESLWTECGQRVSTSLLNRSMTEALTKHQPPVVKRVRAKFYYLTQADVRPPTFVFFVNDPDRIKPSYGKYLENQLRARLGLPHAPMRVLYRASHTKKKTK